MNLERFVAVMRPRTSFEAVDLGFLIVRRFWTRLIVAWLLPTLPIIALLAWALPGQPFLGLPLFWWLKPFFERPLLFVLSRALFGELPRWREVFSSRALGPGLFGDLTWRRLAAPLADHAGHPARRLGRRHRPAAAPADRRQGLRRRRPHLRLLAGGIGLRLRRHLLRRMLLPSGYTGFDGIDFENAETWPIPPASSRR